MSQQLTEHSLLLSVFLQEDTHTCYALGSEREGRGILGIVILFYRLHI